MSSIIIKRTVEPWYVFLYVLHFKEAGQALIAASSAGSHVPNILEKANSYIARAEQLRISSKFKAVHINLSLSIQSTIHVYR